MPLATSSTCVPDLVFVTMRGFPFVPRVGEEV
jgi:hypothetical protein